MTRMLGATVTAVLVLTVAGLAGWLIFAAITGSTLVTFRTGSMAPTMPQGAIAVTVPTAAADLTVGDVVTIERGANELPITHRVVEIRTLPNDTTAHGQARELMLKGDANATVDRSPYTVTEVGRVVFSVPHAGTALQLAQSPIGMGILTVLAAALATWAFWPRGDEPEPGGADSVAPRQVLETKASP